jgi:peroxiredoxin
MSNFLTGDYEAVFEIAMRQINGVLGTLHQNAEPQALPPGRDQPPVAEFRVIRPPFPFPLPPALQTPHSITTRIADSPWRPPGDGVFADWVIEFQRAGPGRSLRQIEKELTTTAPPGAAQMLTDAFAALDRIWVVPPPGQVQGLAKIQASSVKITVAEGSSSEITVNVNIRAVYYPDPSTTNLPAPIHGDVEAAFEVRTIASGSGTRLAISPSSQDAKIQFHAAPGSGLSAADENTLAVHIRNFLRHGLNLPPVDLPANFPFSAFKGLGSGSSQVIALPFQLSGAPAPASGVQPLTQSFVGASGFAVAVSKDYVLSQIDLDAIRAGLDGQTFTRVLTHWPLHISVTYTLHFTSGPTAVFQSGGIQISGTVAVTGNKWWSPNASVSFTQLVTLVPDLTNQQAILARVGDPDVTIDPSYLSPIFHDIAANIVKSQFDTALANNTSKVRVMFSNARSMLFNGLRTFDPFASVWFSGLEVTPDGVIVRGDIGSAARRPPVVDIKETEHSTAFTAFESWIPAGRIDRFIWSWVEHSSPYTVWGVEKSSTDEHRFIFPKPAAATQLSQICLRIEGTQILPGGQEVSVAGGATCGLGEIGVEMDVPAWFGPVTLPIWRPGVADDAVLRNAIAAHVSLQVGAPGREPLPRNVLVYFADWRRDRPLDSLNAALARAKKSSTLMVIVVLPAGAFDRPRREIESKLPAQGERRTLVQFTEDDEGGWSSMFAVAKLPAAYLINAKREFVWKHEGDPNPAELAAAIDQHQVPTSEPRFRPLRLSVSHGDVPPDALFKTDAGEEFALHRFIGREVLLNFWQSWSAPCLTELARLQRLHEDRRSAPFIVAFHGGNKRDALEQVRKRLRLSFPLVQDSQQRIAQQFGVRCWPTTILVAADGRMEHIQFGIAHEQAAPSSHQTGRSAP